MKCAGVPATIIIKNNKQYHTRIDTIYLYCPIYVLSGTHVFNINSSICEVLYVTYCLISCQFFYSDPDVLFLLYAHNFYFQILMEENASKGRPKQDPEPRQCIYVQHSGRHQTS